VAAEVARTLDFFKIPVPEKEEVLTAFAAHKDEVTAGYFGCQATSTSSPPGRGSKG
jgi:hypothetical protein